MGKKILIVEDEPTQRRMLALLAQKRLGLGAIEADDGEMALSILRNGLRKDDICLAIVDFQMPKMDGLELLEVMQQQFRHLPVIMLTGSKDISIAVKAMKLGACDFLNKPIDAERFQVSAQNALKIGMLEKEVSRLKHKGQQSLLFEDMVGHDSGLQDIINIGYKAAVTDISVMISGETGVGKDVFARAIHGESTRAKHPFVAVNCGAIPENLVESTLFGHEKGAFTGAVSRALGHFREADKGTIFLDEIGELSLDAQVRLLRVLQEKEVRSVGSDSTVPIDVRVIAATNRDLKKEVELGRFREDLYFRLNILPISLPTLRERKGDIIPLAYHFMQKISDTQGWPQKTLEPDAEKFLLQHDWPGNIRELENTVYRAIVLSENDILGAEDFQAFSEGGISRPPETTNEDIQTPLSGQTALPLFSPNGTMKTMDELEQDAMQFSLTHHEQNVTQAARALGIAKSTFYRKMKNRED